MGVRETENNHREAALQQAMPLEDVVFVIWTSGRGEGQQRGLTEDAGKKRVGGGTPRGHYNKTVEYVWGIATNEVKARKTIPEWVERGSESKGLPVLLISRRTAK